MLFKTLAPLELVLYVEDVLAFQTLLTSGYIPVLKSFVNS